MKLWKIVSIVLITLALMPSARAQDYPNKPITLVVAWSPGGVTDLVARVIADKLSEVMGNSVVVVNKPGASGIIGTEFVKEADPDGYTLMVITSSQFALTPQLFTDVPYDPLKDFIPIVQVTSAPAIMVVPPSLPADTVAEFVDLAKEKPGELNYATFGKGSSSHLAAELFQLKSGTELVQIPYKGAGPAITDMIGDAVQLDVFFDSIPSALPYVRDGRLKALAVTSKERTGAAPEIPTVAETYPGFDLTVWQGLGAPANTPPEVIEKIHDAVAKVMAMPDVRKRFIDLGADPLATTPEEFATFIKAENEKWDDLLDKMGIEPEDL